MLFEEGRIEYLYSFSNERFFFPAVDHRVKFTLLGAQRGEPSDGFWATFRFNPRVAVRPGEMAEFLADPSNLIYLKLETVERLSPDALTVFEFKDQLDYSIAEKIYGNHPLLGDSLPGSWNVKFTREFDKTNDRDLFNYAGIGRPVLQGANLGFYGEVLEEPTIWIDEDLGRSRLLATIAKTTGGAELAEAPLDYEGYRFGFRRIARATDTRTLYVSWLPKRYFAMYTLTTTVQRYFDGKKFVGYMTQPQQMFLYACMASYCLDFIMRFQVSTSVAMFNAYSLPVPRLTAGNLYFDAIVPRAARLTCTRADSPISGGR